MPGDRKAHPVNFIAEKLKPEQLESMNENCGKFINIDWWKPMTNERENPDFRYITCSVIPAI